MYLFYYLHLNMAKRKHANKQISEYFLSHDHVIRPIMLLLYCYLIT